jgi:hypothetical protein
LTWIISPSDSREPRSAPPIFFIFFLLIVSPSLTRENRLVVPLGILSYLAWCLFDFALLSCILPLIWLFGLDLESCAMSKFVSLFYLLTSYLLSLFLYSFAHSSSLVRVDG